MPISDLARRLDRIRETLEDADHDPKALHDEVRRAIDLFEQHGDTVPPDLREAIEALKAEVVEEFYDNLPV